MALTPAGWWTGRNVLVTGHTGFKGAWLSLWLERLGANVSGLALPADDEEGAYQSLGARPAGDSHFVDLLNAPAVRTLVHRAQPEIVFHLAAQSLVRRGWASPSETYAVNVVGTSHLLEAVAKVPSVRAVVAVTSDKVYANDGSGVPFMETAPLGGGDPYSASKAAAEHVVTAWRRANEQSPIATVRAGNVIGGGDVAADRLLVDVWRALRAGDDLVLRNPKAHRPWQFVLDPLAGYLLTAHRLATEPESCPPALNFGPPPEACWSVDRVADAVLSAWGSGTRVDRSEPFAPPEAPTLRLDSSLASAVLGWRARLDPETAISWTVEWWRAHAGGCSLPDLAGRQIDEYERLLG